MLMQGAGGGGEGVEHQWNTIIINGPQGGSDKPLEQHFPLAGLREGTEYQAGGNTFARVRMRTP
jgi:hypothetical protein